MAGKRWDMTTVKGFPEVDKPLREGERTIKNEWEEETFVVMPDVGQPPRRGVGGNRSKESGERKCTEAFLGDRKRGRRWRNNKPAGGIDEVGRRRR